MRRVLYLECGGRKSVSDSAKASVNATTAVENVDEAIRAISLCTRHMGKSRDERTIGNFRPCRW